MVPILHFWNSLGKEAPLHLLLFVVADIISFPARSVRVSCHSIKILLCCREGIVGVYVCVRAHVYVFARAFAKRDRSSRMVCCICPLVFFTLLKSQINLLSAITASAKSYSEQKPAKNEVPLFVSSLIYFFFHVWVCKKKKC